MEPAHDVRRLHPLTLVQRFVVSLPGYVLLALPALRGGGEGAWFNVALAGVVALLTLPLIALQYLRFRYWVTPDEMVIVSGVLTQRKRVIPLDRVQNVEIEQPVLPRLFGLARVKVETAGSGKTEGVIEYVTMAEAQRLRGVVRRLQQGPTPAVQAPAVQAPAAQAPAAPEPASLEARAAPGEEEAAPRTLFALSTREVLLSGMMRFSFLYIVLAFSGLQYFNVDPDEIADLFVRGPLRPLAATFEASPWLAGLATVLVAVLLSWLTGIAVNLNRYHGFRLALEGDKLHRRSGLLTVYEGTIPLRRIQTLELRTNPLMRRFGWYALALQTMGIDEKERGRQLATPFSQRRDIEQQAPLLYPFRLPEAFRPVARVHVRRVLVRSGLVLALAVGGLALVWKAALWGLTLAPLAALHAVLAYRHHGYWLDGDVLYVRRGVLRQRLWIVPLARLQVLLLSATFFQRRLGVATVAVDTAGADALRYPRVIDLPRAEAEALAATLYARFQAAVATPPSRSEHSPR